MFIETLISAGVSQLFSPPGGAQLTFDEAPDALAVSDLALDDEPRFRVGDAADTVAVEHEEVVGVRYTLLVAFSVYHVELPRLGVR